MAALLLEDHSEKEIEEGPEHCGDSSRRSKSTIGNADQSSHDCRRSTHPGYQSSDHDGDSTVLSEPAFHGRDVPIVSPVYRESPQEARTASTAHEGIEEGRPERRGDAGGEDNEDNTGER